MDKVPKLVELTLPTIVWVELKYRATRENKPIYKVIEDLLVCECGELRHTCNCGNDE